MKFIVLFSGLCLCCVAHGFEPSTSLRSRRRTSRYRPSSAYALSRSSPLLYDQYDIHTPEAIRMPKRFDSYIPTLNNPPGGSARSQREYSFTTASGGLRKPSRNAFAVDIESTKAEKHFFEMEVKAACASPRQRVICVQDHYPDAKIVYRPACTILHRCDRYSGCCQHPKTCQPAASEQVSLFFKTSDTASPVLKLDFTNHTSCRCDISEDSVRPAETPAQPSGSVHGREIEEHLEDDLVDDESLVGSALDDCPKCPRPFSKRIERGLCQCDCFDGDSACKSVKKGRDRISEEDRRCVQRGSCNKPSCAVGHYYNVAFGECRKPTYERLLHREGESEIASSTRASDIDSDSAGKQHEGNIEDDSKKDEFVNLDDEMTLSHRRRHQRRHHKRQV